MNADLPPTLDDLEDHLSALTTGHLARDAADRWASRWITREDISWDDLSWWALNLLHGVDLPADGSGDFLHDEEQLGEWLAEFRERRSLRDG